MMKDRATKTNDEEAALAAKLLPDVARKKLTRGPADHIGASVFYDVRPGWETDLVRQDADVAVVATPREMERAMAAPEIATIFIPAGAMARDAARRICERSGLRKTVFYEVSGES